MEAPDKAAAPPESEREFRDALRRRGSWGAAAAWSSGLALLFTFIGMEASSRISMGLGGCAFAVAGVSIGQLTANGYVAPTFGESLFGRESVRSKQYGAAFVLLLWGIFCFVVAFHLK